MSVHGKRNKESQYTTISSAKLVHGSVRTGIWDRKDHTNLDRRTMSPENARNHVSKPDRAWKREPFSSP
jgi:hypothetical protein